MEKIWLGIYLLFIYTGLVGTGWFLRKNLADRSQLEFVSFVAILNAGVVVINVWLFGFFGGVTDPVRLLAAIVVHTVILLVLLILIFWFITALEFLFRAGLSRKP